MNPRGRIPFFAGWLIFVMIIVIMYQAFITFIFPFRLNVLLLLLELCFFVWILWRIIWPC